MVYLYAPPPAEVHVPLLCGESLLDEATTRDMRLPIACGDTQIWCASGTAPGHGTLAVTPAEEEHPLPERYEERALLGEGAMGQVLLCKDRRVGRLVAVKRMRRELAARTDLRRRFLREAHVQGRLEHPCIASVYDVGTGEPGSYYFTMQYLRGITLDQLLWRLHRRDAALAATFDRRRLLDVFRDVCDAVAFAHERGVIHRDLKPGNILVGPRGEVHVLDWGLAKIVHEPDAQEDDAEEGMLFDVHTTGGQILGTPGYMAPEQARGDVDDVGFASDVYSLGAILFEMLALRPLHPGGRAHEAILSTLRGADARLHVRAPGAAVPPELSALCVKATSMAPGDRHAWAGELLAAIDAFLAHCRVPPPPTAERNEVVASATMPPPAGAAPRRRADAWLGAWMVSLIWSLLLPTLLLAGAGGGLLWAAALVPLALAGPFAWLVRRNVRARRASRA